MPKNITDPDPMMENYSQHETVIRPLPGVVKTSPATLPADSPCDMKVISVHVDGPMAVPTVLRHAQKVDEDNRLLLVRESFEGSIAVYIGSVDRLGERSYMTDDALATNVERKLMGTDGFRWVTEISKNRIVVGHGGLLELYRLIHVYQNNPGLSVVSVREGEVVFER